MTTVAAHSCMIVRRRTLRLPVGFVIDTFGCTPQNTQPKLIRLIDSIREEHQPADRLTILYHKLGRDRAHGVYQRRVWEVVVSRRQGEIAEELCLVDEILAKEALAEEDIAEVVDDLGIGQTGRPIGPKEVKELPVT